MKRLIDYTRMYRYYFKWSIIPAREGTKIPIVEWKKYQKELIPLGEIESIFKNKNLNIALVTGELSRIVVVDLDNYKQKGGTINLTSPLSVKTPHGGTHLYFKHNKTVHNSVNSEIAVDFRGDGGIVFLPPSIIEEKRYTWNTEPTIELLKTLPVLPDEVLQTLRPKPKNNTEPFEKFNLSNVIGTTVGSRNDSLLRAVDSLLNGMPENDWGTKGFLAAQGINSTFKPPLPEHEIQTIFRQACNFIKNNPKQIKTKITIQTNPIWTSKTFSDLIDEIKTKRKQGEAKGIESSFQSLDKFTNGFQLGQTYLFFGDTNTGKSCLVLNFLINLAKLKNKVTYFDLENNSILTTERMVLINDANLSKIEWNNIKETNIADPFMDALKNLPFHLEDTTSLNNRFGSITYEAVETIIKEQVQKGCKIFGIDHLHYFEPSEKNYGYLQDIAKKLNDLAGKLNIIILILAHTRKGLIREKDGSVQVYRPTTDDIAGSGLISRHTKNIIGIMRNATADDPIERQKTYLFIDKTKTGNVGKIQLFFNPNTLHFKETI